jgi:two-component system sensor histidine kinase KdpD
VVDGGLKSLTTLVTDLLDVSRLNAKALPISLVVTDPEEVIVAALDELELGPSQVTLDAVPVPMVSADPPLLRRAISNLLLNAKRFNPPQRRIGISLSAFRSTVEIRVVDYGPGCLRRA